MYEYHVYVKIHSGGIRHLEKYKIEKDLKMLTLFLGTLYAPSSGVRGCFVILAFDFTGLLTCADQKWGQTWTDSVFYINCKDNYSFREHVTVV